MRRSLLALFALVLTGCGPGVSYYETLTTMKVELAQSRAALAAAKVAYGEAHPDVKRLQARADAWKEQAGDLAFRGYRFNPCRYAARLWLAVARVDVKRAELATTLMPQNPKLRALVVEKKKLEASARAAAKGCHRP